MSISRFVLVIVARNNVEDRVMHDVDGLAEDLRGENFSSLSD